MGECINNSGTVLGYKWAPAYACREVILDMLVDIPLPDELMWQVTIWSDGWDWEGGEIEISVRQRSVLFPSGIQLQAVEAGFCSKDGRFNLDAVKAAIEKLKRWWKVAT
jgi:hypothetical protein